MQDKNNYFEVTCKEILKLDHEIREDGLLSH